MFGAEDLVEVWPVVGGLTGRQAVRDHFAGIFAAMPDFHIEIERVAADGDTVFVHWHLTGTFTGAPFLGIMATGRPIDLRGTDCFTVRTEKSWRTSLFTTGSGSRCRLESSPLTAAG